MCGSKTEFTSISYITDYQGLDSVVVVIVSQCVTPLVVRRRQPPESEVHVGCFAAPVEFTHFSLSPRKGIVCPSISQYPVQLAIVQEF